MEQNFSFNTDAFQIRAVKNGEKKDQYMVTLGNQLASPRRFNSYEEAEQAINDRDWDMIACDFFNSLFECEIFPCVYIY